MAQTRGLSLPTAKPWALRLRPVTALRVAIILAVVVIWEAVSASGLLYRDVVPSLLAIGRALYATLSDPTFYFHLGTTAYEIAIALVIGGLSGLAIGILLGGSRLLSRAYEAYLYYLGPCPKIIFFPIMIMWFGVGPGSKVAMGAISCFFPVALNIAGGMREIDKVLIRVGKSFRANGWQMVTVARGDEALQPRDRVFGDSGLQHLQHAADVRAADHPLRDRNRCQRADRAIRRSRRHQRFLSALLLALEVSNGCSCRGETSAALSQSAVAS
jgi:hypothetical protein